MSHLDKLFLAALTVAPMLHGEAQAEPLEHLGPDILESFRAQILVSGPCKGEKIGEISTVGERAETTAIALIEKPYGENIQLYENLQRVSDELMGAVDNDPSKKVFGVVIPVENTECLELINNSPDVRAIPNNTFSGLPGEGKSMSSDELVDYLFVIPRRILT